MRKNFAEAPNRAPFYSERKYNNNWSKATGNLDYQEAYEQNAIGCHGKCTSILHSQSFLMKIFSFKFGF